ncbi:MAG: class I SAM-dependent methyltransferase [Rhizomicrobium sp.]
MTVALAHEAAGQAGEALAAAWTLLDAAPDDRQAKALVARLLLDSPDLIAPDRASSLHALLGDAEVDPWFIGPAGWILLSRETPLLRASAAPADVARWLETNLLAQQLLRETHVTNLDVEISLTALRRWLLLTDCWPAFPRSVAALAAQTVRNDGAWLFDAEEEERLGTQGDADIARAYRPPPPPFAVARPAHADPTTRAVAGQYESWPYPAWSRIMVSKTTILPRLLEKLDPGGPGGAPLRAEILVAGCGTGREAAIWARQCPDADITAIDISEASLRYGAERCAAAGLRNITFLALDLHDVASLQTRFDAIICSGVLHHLPDPEAGWEALLRALKPGGVMRVMVYSAVARLRIRAARTLITDLAAQPVDADLLRAVRRRLIEKAPALVAGSPDFYTLASVFDLLLHRHEDAFDVPRIARAIERLGLVFLGYALPPRRRAARFRAGTPIGTLYRDIAAWGRLERDDPFLFSQMYDFWCRKPLS